MFFFAPVNCTVLSVLYIYGIQSLCVFVCLSVKDKAFAVEQSRSRIIYSSGPFKYAMDVQNRQPHNSASSGFCILFYFFLAILLLFRSQCSDPEKRFYAYGVQTLKGASMPYGVQLNYQPLVIWNLVLRCLFP